MGDAAVPLAEYKAKRDFSRTPESAGEAVASSARPIFVIQKHAASTLHYDFRLEVDGVLKSWAVPKGPSTNPREKRLAVPTEDHPMAYAAFEGSIPAGSYGAGTVLVWDTGAYRNLRAEKPGVEPVSMSQALEEGKVEVWLEGKKLHGGYALVRTGKAGAPKANWLLIKMSDDQTAPARNVTREEPNSALTGRSLEEIAAG